MTALEQALLHLPHIGPKRAERLAAAGCGCWSAILAADNPLRLAPERWAETVAAARRSLEALAADDPRPLSGALATAEHWRVLDHWFDRASFFDIETSGLEPESEVTLVACLHRGELRLFLKGENLDDFLGLLEEVKLLVSFNGSGFDVPRIEDRFHVPRIPCAHVDLRWLCHHRGWRGGLKAIERQLGLARPADLAGLGGAEAVWLWQLWSEKRDPAARRTLERYCAADTVALQRLAAELLAAHGCAVTVPEAEALWRVVHARLPPPDRPVVRPPPAPLPPLAAAAAAAADPARSRAEKQKRLRELWRGLRR
jgi:uncharacterized protein YprB with RNaseH-like and TPR domain